MFRGIFGEKETHREQYEEAEQQRFVLEQQKEHLRASNSGFDRYTKEHIERFNVQWDHVQDNMEKADKELERLRKAGHAEALTLHRKHDELKAKLVQATESLAAFEREELGMKTEDDKEDGAVGGTPEEEQIAREQYLIQPEKSD